jgi:hypothetical protein
MPSIFHSLFSVSSLIILVKNSNVEAAGVNYDGRKYCSPEDSCFPSVAELTAFNRSVSGHLHVERPIGAICFPADPAYNPMACAAQSSSSTDDQWISDHFPS